MRILAKFPLDRNQKTLKLNTNLFCEFLGKKQKTFLLIKVRLHFLFSLIFQLC